MKRLGKETIIEVVSFDGVESKRTNKIRTIYEEHGKEVVHFVKGYRYIKRINGIAHLFIDIRTIQATPFSEIVKLWRNK